MRATDSAEAGPARRTLRRMSVHGGYLLSSLVGDDVFGRRVRGWVLRALGARIAPGASLHGGTYVTRPELLSVGANSFVNRNCYFDTQAQTTIGQAVMVGHGATLVTSRHELGPAARRCGPVIAQPIAVGDGAWLGANVTLLPGVTVGAGSVVAAGAVVRENVPPNCLVAGVPARLVRHLDDGAPTAPTAAESQAQAAEPSPDRGSRRSGVRP